MAAVLGSQPFSGLQSFLQRLLARQTPSLSPTPRIIFYDLTRDTAQCPYSGVLRRKGLRNWLNYAAKQCPVLLLVWGSKLQVGTPPRTVWKALRHAIEEASLSSGNGPVAEVFSPQKRERRPAHGKTRLPQAAQPRGERVVVLFLGEAQKRNGRFDIAAQLRLQRLPAVVVQYHPALHRVGYPLIPLGIRVASTPNVTYLDTMLTQYLSDAVSALADHTASASSSSTHAITRPPPLPAAPPVEHIKHRLYQWWTRTTELETAAQSGGVQQETFVEDAKSLRELASMTLKQQRDTSTQVDLYVWLCRAQAALFDVPTLTLTDMDAALRENDRRITGKRHCNGKVLEDLKRKIRVYRSVCPEPEVDLQTGPASSSSTLLERAKAIYYGAMGTSPPQFLTHTVGKHRFTIAAKHLRLQARLHRMLAARWALRSFFRKKGELGKPCRRLDSSERAYAAKAFHHALSAYRLEVVAQTSLPTLHHHSLNPPSVHLVAALIGAGYPVKVLKRALMEVEHAVAPVRLPSKAAITRKPVIGRARGGKPRLDRGKKRYLWLGPAWKPPWAPRRHWRPEEWSWKF